MAMALRLTLSLAFTMGVPMGAAAILGAYLKWNEMQLEYASVLAIMIWGVLVVFPVAHVVLHKDDQEG